MYVSSLSGSSSAFCCANAGVWIRSRLGFEELVEPLGHQQQFVQELGVARLEAFLFFQVRRHVAAESHVLVNPLAHVA